MVTSTGKLNRSLRDVVVHLPNLSILLTCSHLKSYTAQFICSCTGKICVSSKVVNDSSLSNETCIRRSSPRHSTAGYITELRSRSRSRSRSSSVRSHALQVKIADSHPWQILEQVLSFVVCEPTGQSSSQGLRQPPGCRLLCTKETIDYSRLTVERWQDQHNGESPFRSVAQVGLSST